MRPRRALVLNAGASWCAYQVGALRHLVGERGWTFDLCAGTGIGAMNAAFVACGRLEALEGFWSRLRPLDLLPRRRARFITTHVSERLLADRGCRLLVSALNLQTGRLEVLEYPGAGLPLVDSLLAAGAFPGLTRPVRYGGGQLVEGTLVDGVPMGPALARRPEELVAVLPMVPTWTAATAAGISPRRYETWPAVMRRAVEMDQAHDARRALVDARATAVEAAAYREVGRRMAQATVGVRGGTLAARLSGLVEAAQPPAGPRVVAVVPSRPLDLPIWRFSRSGLAGAAAMGESDARAAVERAAAAEARAAERAAAGATERAAKGADGGTAPAPGA